MKHLCVALLAMLLSTSAYAIGAAGDTPWPTGAIVDVKLQLTAVTDTNGLVKISGHLLITNPGDTALTIQDPHNRSVLYFMVVDSLGNPVAPKTLGKADPDFRTHTLAARATYTHRIESFDFVTGGAYLTYELKPGSTNRIIAVYRPAGPRGPGFSTPEAELVIRK